MNKAELSKLLEEKVQKGSTEDIQFRPTQWTLPAETV
jgi:hypothetical protein